MGAFNVVEKVPVTCPRCGDAVEVGVQFKFGATWQYSYVIGDVLAWGRNDIGLPGMTRVVLDGTADSECPRCGHDGDWDCYVFVEHDRITAVRASDDSYDFGPDLTYLDLGEKGRGPPSAS